jgi:hypothetical protein
MIEDSTEEFHTILSREEGSARSPKRHNMVATAPMAGEHSGRLAFILVLMCDLELGFEYNSFEFNQISFKS